MSDKEHIQNLIKTKKRQLQILQQQRAEFGELHVPAHIITQIENLEAELDKLETQLTETSPNPASQLTIDNSQLPIDNQMPITNPFYTGGRINDPHYFFGRERLVREIRSELKKRASVSLVGDSQLGKSSLLYYLYATRREWLPGVTVEYIDLQSVLDERDFCETVLGKLGEKGKNLRHLKRALTGREVVLLFDEMERLAEQDFNPRLHDLLRSLAQEPHFAMCLVTQHPLIEVFPARTPGGVSPFHNIFTVKTLGPFSEAEARAFVLNRLANIPITFTEAEIDSLLAQSQGHPAHLQQLAKALFAKKVSLGEF